jgi:hypothetical protein
VEYINSPSGPLYALSQAPLPASAVPAHLLPPANTQSPLASPGTSTGGDIGYFTEVRAAEDVSMEDVATPTPANLGILPRDTISRDGLTAMDMSAEMVDKLTLLDK